MREVHDIRCTLNTRLGRFSGLQLPPQFRREHLKYPAVGILVNEGPVEVEDDELFLRHLNGKLK